MAHYVVKHSAGDHGTGGLGGSEMTLAQATAEATDRAKKHRGTTAQVLDTTGAVLFTAGPFSFVTSQGT